MAACSFYYASAHEPRLYPFLACRHQLERVNLALQIVKARCEEESKRADAAETRAAGAERTAAQLQHRLTRLHGLVGTHPSLPEDLAVLIRQHTTDTSISHITGKQHMCAVFFAWR